MPLCQQSPKRRFRLPGVLAVAVLLFAAACSLNPSPDNLSVSEGPPVVRLAAPLPNATYLEGVGVNIQAYVSNAGPDIDRVEVTVDDAIIATLPQPNEAGAPIFPVTQSWNATGVGTHTVGVTAFRGDGTASEPATETITVISSVSPTAEPTATSAPTATPETEETGEAGGEATAEETDNGGDEEETETSGGGSRRTSGAPVATFNQGANIRRGPGTNFEPPIGAFAAGQTTDVVGRNPAGDWYKVRYYNADGWVFASLVTVEGDTSNLPVDAGPPTPVPVTPTPVPPAATPVPQTQANLVAGNIRLNPQQPMCKETFQVHVDLANLGSEDTTTTGRFTVQDIHTATGQVVGSTEGAIPIIKAGQTVDSGPVPLTVDAYFGEEHTIVIVLNPNGSIPETGAGDNRRELKYTLQKGSCG